MSTCGTEQTLAIDTSGLESARCCEAMVRIGLIFLAVAAEPPATIYFYKIGATDTTTDENPFPKRQT